MTRPAQQQFLLPIPEDEPSPSPRSLLHHAASSPAAFPAEGGHAGGSAAERPSLPVRLAGGYDMGAKGQDHPHPQSQAQAAGDGSMKATRAPAVLTMAEGEGQAGSEQTREGGGSLPVAGREGGRGGVGGMEKREEQSSEVQGGAGGAEGAGAVLAVEALDDANGDGGVLSGSDASVWCGAWRGEGGVFVGAAPGATYFGVNSGAMGEEGVGEMRSVQRLWEGELCEGCEDPALASQTACCPCVTFGQNMHMAGFGDCPSQSLAYCFLTYGLCSCGQLLSFLSSMHLFSTLGFLLFCLGNTYAARFRSHMRHRFNIYGDEVSDCAYHAFCSWCALCQEGRTLRLNNVSRGIWGGRGQVTNLVTQTKPLILIPPLPFHMTAKSSSDDLQSKGLVTGGGKKRSFLGIDLGSLSSTSMTHVDTSRDGIELASGESGDSDDHLSPKFHPFSCKDSSPIPFLSMGR